eukprot:COSAG02_NODE_60_length_43475_cov_59.494582_26_plen_72_part_00
MYVINPIDLSIPNHRVSNERVLGIPTRNSYSKINQFVSKEWNHSALHGSLSIVKLGVLSSGQPGSGSEFRV